jgi:hypothetical protein
LLRRFAQRQNFRVSAGIAALLAPVYARGQ